MRKHKIHVNDKVMVLTGKDRGKVGKVKKIFGKKDRVLVEQINMVKRHTKPNPYSGQSGGIVDKESPIHYSNVALICGACTKTTRVGYTFTDDGRKLRFCKKCNEMID
jgi:large subunit ribosomal protein L24